MDTTLIPRLLKAKRNSSALPSDDPTEASSTPDHDADIAVDQVPMVSGKANGDPTVAQATGLPIDIEKAQSPASNEAHHSGVEADASGDKGEASTPSQRKPGMRRRERAKKAPT
nr:hypothetical protein [Sinorhizobium sp. 8-89]